MSLDIYYIPTRYPTDYFDKQKAEDAINATDNIIRKNQYMKKFSMRLKSFAKNNLCDIIQKIKKNYFN